MRKVRAQIIVRVPPRVGETPVEYAISETIHLLEGKIRKELMAGNKLVDPIIVLKFPPQVSPKIASRIVLGLALRFPEQGVTTVEQRELPVFAHITLA